MVAQVDSGPEDDSHADFEHRTSGKRLSLQFFSHNQVNTGDSNFDAKKVYPLQFPIRQVLEDPSLLNGKRTEVSLEVKEDQEDA